MRNVRQRGFLRERRQGFVLLDAMIAIVIFSIGILGMVSLQSNAVSFASDARYRTTAAMLADQVIAQMWVADPTALAANFQGNNGTGGAKYLAWNNLVVGSSTLGPQYGLPDGGGQIVVDQATGDVTVTVTWTVPSDRAAAGTAAHSYITSTQIVR